MKKEQYDKEYWTCFVDVFYAHIKYLNATESGATYDEICKLHDNLRAEVKRYYERCNDIVRKIVDDVEI